MCISDYTDYIKEEVEAAADDRFDRVIGFGTGSEGMVKTRNGSKVLTTVFHKVNGGWKATRRYTKQIEQVKN